MFCFQPVLQILNKFCFQPLEKSSSWKTFFLSQLVLSVLLVTFLVILLWFFSSLILSVPCSYLSTLIPGVFKVQQGICLTILESNIDLNHSHWVFSFEWKDLEITNFCKVSDPLLSFIDQSSFILTKPLHSHKWCLVLSQTHFPRATSQVTFSHMYIFPNDDFQKWQLPHEWKTAFSPLRKY